MMRRNPAIDRSARRGKPLRRPRDADIPEVPTVRTDPGPGTAPAAETAEDEIEAEVRRMVEAAYT